MPQRWDPESIAPTDPDGLQPGQAAEVDAWLEPAVESALRSVVPHHMDGASAALYARWWQLECWLRSLVYVELRALHGVRWVDAVKAANLRLEQDAIYTHMAGPDSDNPLAYLDYSQVLQVAEKYWSNVGYALVEKASWDGRQVELKRIRHRIGHMRRPHGDDLNRLEQTLRDLERGTFIALSSYNDRRRPSTDEHNDPVSRAWLLGEHEDARRLVRHADQQYETRLILRSSSRPWAEPAPADLSDAPGHLWHAEFLRRGQGIDVASLWRDVESSRLGQLLLHLEAHDPNHVGFTFSAADDAESIADAIGSAFDFVLLNPAHRDDDRPGWSRRMRDMDYRVVSGDGWTIVDETTIPISNFGAGGGVTIRPRRP